MKLDKEVLARAYAASDHTSKIHFVDYLRAGGLVRLTSGSRLDIFGIKFRDLLLSAVRLKFLGLFEWLMLEAPYAVKTNKDLLISVINNAADFKNHNVLAATVKYVEQTKLQIYDQFMTPLHMIMHFW